MGKSFSKREFLCILFLDIIIMGGLLVFTGAVFSGFHLVDDHTVLSISTMLESSSVLEVARSLFMSELGSRFRPLYDILLVVKTVLVGTNMNYWMFISAAEGVLSFLLFYYSARLMNAGKVPAFFFASLILVGEQITPWYRSLNQENTGTFLLSLISFLLVMRYKAGCGKKWTNSFFYSAVVLVLITLLSFQKEAYVLLVPFWCMFVIYLEMDVSGAGFVSAIKNKLFFILVLAGIFVFEIIFIVTVTKGGGATGYAGFSSETSVMDYLNGILESVDESLKWYLVLLIIGALLSIGLYKDGIKAKERVLLLISFGIMGSQVVLHARSGMWERYMHPFIWGWGLVTVLLIFKVLTKRRWAHYVYAVLCMLLLIYGAVTAYEHAERWADDGENIEALFKDTLSLDTDAKVLSDTGWMEWDLAIPIWLDYYYDEYPEIVQASSADPEGEGYAISDYDALIIQKKTWKNLNQPEKDSFLKKAKYKIDGKTILFVVKDVND